MVTFACVMGLIFGIGAFICAISKFASYVGKNIAPAVSNDSLDTRFDLPKEARTHYRSVGNGAVMAGVAGAAAMAGAGAFNSMKWDEDNQVPVSDTNDLSKVHEDGLVMDPYFDPAQSHLVGNLYHDDHEESFGSDTLNDPAYSSFSGNIFHDSSDDFSSSSMDTSSTFDSDSLFDSFSSFGSDSMFDSISSSCDSGISFD